MTDSGMQVSDLHPELQPAMKRMPSLQMTSAFKRKLFRFFNRLGVTNTACDPSVDMHTHRIENTTIRIYVPSGAKSGQGLLWIHGGGMCVGNTAQDNRFCSQYAKNLGAVVVSVEYRLAPEHPFPCALDDCHQAWHWFQENAQQYSVDPSRIAIGGQSAGGGLAASLCQKIADSHAIQPMAQLLWSPMLDDRTSAKRELDSINHLVWNNPSNRRVWSWYLGEYFETETMPPYAVPARQQQLSKLPPTWIGIGSIELFYEESIAYAEALESAGVPCVTDIIPNAQHCFDVISPDSKLVADYYQRHFDFVRQLKK